MDCVAILYAGVVSVVSNTAEIVVPGLLLHLLCNCYSQPSMSNTLSLLALPCPRVTMETGHPVFSLQSLACANSHSPLH